MTCRSLSTALAGTWTLALHVQAKTRCKYIPGDGGWPSSDDWSILNNTVQGRLIQTIPQASVCHTLPYSDFDATACEGLKATWTKAQI